MFKLSKSNSCNTSLKAGSFEACFLFHKHTNYSFAFGEMLIIPLFKIQRYFFQSGILRTLKEEEKVQFQFLQQFQYTMSATRTIPKNQLIIYCSAFVLLEHNTPRTIQFAQNIISNAHFYFNVIYHILYTWVVIWDFKLLLVLNVRAQILHLCGRSPEWIVMCAFRFCLFLNLTPHKRQVKPSSEQYWSSVRRVKNTDHHTVKDG